MADSALEKFVEEFDRVAFATEYATEIAADGAVSTWLEELNSRVAGVGEGFARDARCQWLAVNISHHAKNWKINKDHAAWKASNSI